MVVCPFCNKPITNIPKIIEEVKVHNCGAKYYIMVGDVDDVMESIMDYLDVIFPKELEFIEIQENRITVKHRGIEIIAISEDSEESEENFGLKLWFVFIYS